MAIQLKWASPERLDNMMWGLELLLDDARGKHLDADAARDQESIATWLKDIAKLKTRSGSIPLDAVPPFPLNRTQLHDLRVAIHEAATESTSASHRFIDPAGHLMQGVRSLSISSWLIGFALVALVGADVATFWIEVSRSRMEVINLTGLVIILVIWLYHHFAAIHPHLHDLVDHISIHHNR